MWGEDISCNDAEVMFEPEHDNDKTTILMKLKNKYKLIMLLLFFKQLKAALQN